MRGKGHRSQRSDVRSQEVRKQRAEVIQEEKGERSKVKGKEDIRQACPGVTLFILMSSQFH